MNIFQILSADTSKINLEITILITGHYKKFAENAGVQGQSPFVGGPKGAPPPPPPPPWEKLNFHTSTA